MTTSADFSYLVPYSYRGTFLHFIGDTDVPEWRENEPFSATLSIDWLEPGGSAKRVMILREIDGEKRAFPMFIDDVITMLRNSVVDHGIVKGTFRVKKTGRTKTLYTIVKIGD